MAPRGSRRARALVLEALVEPAPVEQVGQRIVARLVLELALLGAQRTLGAHEIAHQGAEDHQPLDEEDQQRRDQDGEVDRLRTGGGVSRLLLVKLHDGVQRRQQVRTRRDPHALHGPRCRLRRRIGQHPRGIVEKDLESCVHAMRAFLVERPFRGARDAGQVARRVAPHQAVVGGAHLHDRLGEQLAVPRHRPPVPDARRIVPQRVGEPGDALRQHALAPRHVDDGGRVVLGGDEAVQRREGGQREQAGQHERDQIGATGARAEGGERGGAMDRAADGASRAFKPARRRGTWASRSATGRCHGDARRRILDAPQGCIDGLTEPYRAAPCLTCRPIPPHERP